MVRYWVRSWLSCPLCVMTSLNCAFKDLFVCDYFFELCFQCNARPLCHLSRALNLHCTSQICHLISLCRNISPVSSPMGRIREEHQFPLVLGRTSAFLFLRRAFSASSPSLTPSSSFARRMIQKRAVQTVQKSLSCSDSPEELVL